MSPRERPLPGAGGSGCGVFSPKKLSPMNSTGFTPDSSAGDLMSGRPGASIAVNAAIIGERPTGLGLYTLHLIHGLDALGERMIVYTSRPDLISAPRAEIHRIPSAIRPERGALGHLLRLFWVQSGLRARVRRARPRLL